MPPLSFPNRSMWTIYDRPDFAPHDIIVREWRYGTPPPDEFMKAPKDPVGTPYVVRSHRPTRRTPIVVGDHLRFSSISHARQWLRNKGLTMLPPHTTDDRAALETWG